VRDGVNVGAGVGAGEAAEDEELALGSVMLVKNLPPAHPLRANRLEPAL
jgi:hypothetical protein